MLFIFDFKTCFCVYFNTNGVVSHNLVILIFYFKVMTKQSFLAVVNSYEIGNSTLNYQCIDFIYELLNLIMNVLKFITDLNIVIVRNNLEALVKDD